MLIRAFFLGAVLCLSAGSAAVGAVYHVSATGDDGYDGLSPEQPWRTVQRVNDAALQPGDAVLFHRGDTWREQLRPRSGSEAGVVTYGAYGEGPLPVLLGSLEQNRPGDWTETAPNLWTSTEPVSVGECLLPNPEFTNEEAPWSLHCEGGARASAARDTEHYDSAPASWRLDCTEAGTQGSHIQMYIAGIPLNGGNCYRLSFRVKSSAPFSLPPPRLMKAGPPWSSYDAMPVSPSLPVNAEWETVTMYYKASQSADDGRITFFLGQAMPAGAVLHLDDIRLFQCAPGNLFARDVGNIIFNDEALCGVKVWNREDLKEQGRFWYDEERHTVTLWSEKNPALYYTDIECAIREHIIDQSNRSFVTYENLALRYGAAHGIGGGNTHHITVRDCDLSYIGGGDQSGGDKTVRFGNGIEFWGAAHDCLVERCRLWEIYDAALTNQSSGPDTPHYNIVYRFNVIWNCEYSFEYWNRPEKSVTRDIYFDHNTCVDAGFGWGHGQRPDPSGRHLCFYTSPAAISAFHLRNNIFCEAKGNAFYAPGWSKEQVESLVMDYNAWYQSEGAMISIAGEQYPRDGFEEYRRVWNKESHSLVAVPAFVDASQRNYRPAAGSASRDAGTDLGYRQDFDGNPMPKGDAPDIGAFEFIMPE